MLESDFSGRVNPVQAYFHKLPQATGTQAIDELAATVTVRNARHWSEYPDQMARRRGRQCNERPLDVRTTSVWY